MNSAVDLLEESNTDHSKEVGNFLALPSLDSDRTDKYSVGNIQDFLAFGRIEADDLLHHNLGSDRNEVGHQILEAGRIEVAGQTNYPRF